MIPFVYRVAATIPADMLRLSHRALRRDVMERHRLRDPHLADRAIELARHGLESTSLRERGVRLGLQQERGV